MEHLPAPTPVVVSKNRISSYCIYSGPVVEVRKSQVVQNLVGPEGMGKAWMRTLVEEKPFQSRFIK